MATTLDFQASLAQKASELVFEYSIKNQGPGDIGLFNQITAVRPDGTLDVSSHTAYVELLDGVLRVCKRALPVPEHLNMAAYVPPYVSKVAASQTFTEQLVLSLPVRVMQPFLRALMSGQVVADKPDEANVACLEIGYFPIEEPLRLFASNPAHPNLLSAMPPGPAIANQQVVSRRFQLREPVPVLRYRAVPWT